MSSSAVSERFTGRVKWFNNKAGYGFITVTDGSKSGNDVFVHHTSIKVDAEQYKYLVQGEYVDFTLSDTKTSDHEYQAGEVCGIKGGKLMCETRRDNRVSRSQYRTSKSEQGQGTEHVRMPKSVSPPREQKGQTHSRVRENSSRNQEKENEWSYVSRARKAADTEKVSSSRGSSLPRGHQSRGSRDDRKNKPA